MISKELGKITKASFGLGGYQDAQIGLSLTFGGESWGVSTFIGYWATERTERTQWTELDRFTSLGELCLNLVKWLGQAKVNDVSQLKGIPVEITLDGNQLKDWRILTEVL